MNSLEPRVRGSLLTRADDVEPTPELWNQVERRITRRRRLRVAAWSLAGVTAVIVAVLVVPGLLGSGVAPPEIEPVTPGPEPSDDAAEDAEEAPDREVPEPEDPDRGDTDQGERVPEEQDIALDVQIPPLLVGGQDGLRLLRPDTSVTLHTSDAEDQGFVSGLAVRPGSTPDDLTAVVLTTAQGTWELRELRVVDGRVTYEAFPEAYRPGVGSPAGDGLWVTGPVWAPDGDSIAWLEYGTGDTTLRTVGWSDGPGTGDEATDNAMFTLSDTLPHNSTPNDWIAVDGDRTVIRATMPDSNQGWYAIRLARGVDGAWSLDQPDVDVVPVSEPGLGPVGALGGIIDDSDARWLVRLDFDGAVLTEQSGSGEVVQQASLPEDLLPGDGFAELWLEVLDEQVLVGSYSTGAAYVVTPDGEFNPLPGSVFAADVVE